ncbi:YncE family protein [Desulfofundulus sp. TPOSR]|uniref:beta-propeller fold lactonase family protein n=1 Tax=Desulfofundulus sp. TPOSR TaxID=2714340 RepID=UPI00140BA601|nr:YncE family protein [Desulfofundulus sp. TPOSR]NHM26775.1 YncE family protein [Desulfofundulus sp. TPOSR]
MLAAFRGYVANPGDNSIAVLNTTTGTILARVSTGTGPNSVRLAPNGSKVYVTNNGGNTVSVICAETNTPITTITVGNAPADVTVNSTSTRVYVTNSGNNSLSVIDATTDTVVATVGVGTAPIGVAISPDDTRVYVANSGSDNVTVINTATNAVVGAPIAVGDDPRFIDVAPDGRVWVACSGSNNVFVIDPGTNTVIATVAVGTNPTAVKVNPSGTFAYVVNSGSNNVSVISTASFTVTTTIPVGTTPDRLDFDTNPEVAFVRAFVTNFGSNDISIINTTTNTVIGTIANVAFVGGPRGIDIGRLGAVESPGEPIDMTDPYVLEEIKESVCILVDKVYTSCEQRECFPEVNITLPPGGPYVFQSIRFHNGTIVPGSLVITPIPSRPNFSRVQMTVSIAFTATVLNTSTGATVTVDGTLPNILKDIVLFIPPARDEVDLTIAVETRSELLCTPVVSDLTLTIQVGVFLVIKVLGKVQLLVPAFGFCPEPPPCEPFFEKKVDVCANFLNPVKTPFPTDFFPPQLEDLLCQK